nr:GNAT family N-acetyltransferase [Acuticoccus kalidii]
MRLATEADGPALADLVNFAGEGLPLYLWRRLAAPGENPWTIGAHRQAQRAAAGQTVVVDEGSGVLAAMTGYPIGEDPVPIGDDMLPVLRPLQELENKVPGTWYLNVLATYPRARGRGFGARLIHFAESHAAAAGHHGVSIVVADTNVGARRLYERLGYREIERAPVIQDDWETASTEWILLTKAIAS